MRRNRRRNYPSPPAGNRGPAASLAERISAEYARLTPAQRHVAQIIIREPARLAFLSSEAVAAQAQVSDTTVVRMATSLGYRGYGELQRDLQRALTTEMFPRDHLRRTIEEGNENAIVSRLMEVDEISIRATRTALDPTAVQQAAERLYRARRIAILGLRSSLSVAYFLYLRLRDVRDELVLLGHPYGTLTEEIRALGREDLLVAISFARYTAATIEGAAMAWKWGVPVLAITDSTLSPLSPFAFMSLLVRADDVPAAAVAALSLCGALAHAAGRVDPTASKRRLARLEESLRQARVFYDTRG